MLKKLKFLGSLYIYKLRALLGLKPYDIMSAINDYYRDDFLKLEKKEVAVILPHCLIHNRCPAKFSKADGVLCTGCNLCGCGGVRSVAEEKGYQFYISPSVGFTKRLIQRKNLCGIIGVACDYEIDRGIHSERISGNGVRIDKRKIKTQGVRLQAYNCIHNSVDWEKIKALL